VVPSALRTLSVVTLLSAVSGTVVLLNHHGPSPQDQASMSSTDTRLASAALVLPVDRELPASRPEEATYRVQLHRAALNRVQAHTRAVAKAAKLKAAKAKAAKAKAVRAAKIKAAEREQAAAQRRLRASLKSSRSANRDPRSVARLLLADRGWGSSQYSCLVSLWNRESGWNANASNPSSGAFGIPQALPGSKMASAGSDWRTNAATQIRWGLGYIADRYGTPCGAWAHSESTGWY
jgi:hypothetical protein